MKHIKYLFLIFASALVMVSCDKQLDLSPTDLIADDNAFISMTDVQYGVNAVYGRYGTYANDMYINALLSDEAKLGKDNAGQGSFTYRYQFSSDATSGGDVTAAYYGYYYLIDQVNRVLIHVDAVPAKPEEVARRPILKGQLLAMRALGHFGLLQTYSKNYNPADPLGVPLMLASNPLAQPARNSMGDVMTQILKDLNDAKALLPAIISPAGFSDTVMNQINIEAYKARIALYRKDYDSAIASATTVISSGVKPLATGASFAGIWTDVNTRETLFRIRYATSSAIGSMWTTTGDDIYVAPSDKLVAAYDPADTRLEAYIGTTPAGDHYVNKFYESSRGGRVVDMKACRIAEMYLIRAEAYARKAAPDLTSGAADLNTLRAARITGYIDETFSSADALANAVMEERFKELAFEGFRFYDLKRNGLPVVRLASDASPDWQTLLPTDYRFVMPIPRDELNANPNMVQNDGY